MYLLFHHLFSSAFISFHHLFSSPNSLFITCFHQLISLESRDDGPSCSSCSPKRHALLVELYSCNLVVPIPVFLLILTPLLNPKFHQQKTTPNLLEYTQIINPASDACKVFHSARIISKLRNRCFWSVKLLSCGQKFYRRCYVQ